VVITTLLVNRTSISRRNRVISFCGDDYEARRWRSLIQWLKPPARSSSPRQATPRQGQSGSGVLRSAAPARPVPVSGVGSKQDVLAAAGPSPTIGREDGRKPVRFSSHPSGANQMLPHCRSLQRDYLVRSLSTGGVWHRPGAHRNYDHVRCVCEPRVRASPRPEDKLREAISATNAAVPSVKVRTTSGDFRCCSPTGHGGPAGDPPIQVPALPRPPPLWLRSQQL
jgi:hypothetical protein